MSKVTSVYMDTLTEGSTGNGSFLENPGLSKVTLVYIDTSTERYNHDVSSHCHGTL